MDAITEALANAAREQYDGGAFAVDARRAGEHAFDSHDVNREGGDAVWQSVEDEFDPEVDLDDPDLTFSVEVRQEEAFVFLETRDGPGGMPLGTQKPLVALFSGGIDSPVAAWEAMKRGSPVVPLYLDLGRFGGPDHRARAEGDRAETRRVRTGRGPPLARRSGRRRRGGARRTNRPHADALLPAVHVPGRRARRRKRRRCGHRHRRSDGPEVEPDRRELRRGRRRDGPPRFTARCSRSTNRRSSPGPATSAPTATRRSTWAVTGSRRASR